MLYKSARGVTMNYLKLFGLAAFAIGAILYLASGKDHKLVVGEQNYDLGEYVKISDSSSSRIIVQVGEDYSLDVEADKSDLAALKIYVKGHTLVIEDRKIMFDDWQGEIPKITITLPKLKKYTLNGSSDVEITGLHGSLFKAVVNGSGIIGFEGASDELVVEINGSGEVNGLSYKTGESAVVINGSGAVLLMGECTDLGVDIIGSGDFEGKGFKCETVEVGIMGSGDLKVYASDMLDVDVMGTGKVIVYGDPKEVEDQSRNKDHITIIR